VTRNWWRFPRNDPWLLLFAIIAAVLLISALCSCNTIDALPNVPVAWWSVLEGLWADFMSLVHLVF
jgi:hypothetical protein